MKFLRNQILDFEEGDKYRFVYDTLENVETESEETENPNSIFSRKKRQDLDSNEAVDEELNYILGSPTQFSFRDIKFLEKNIDRVKRDKSLAKKLQDMAVYHLSFAQSEISKKMPPRILYEMAGSRRIRQLLPLRLTKSIDDAVDKNIENLKDFAKRAAGDWSMYDTAQVCSLYRHLRKKSSLSEGLNPLFEGITKKLAEKAVSFATRQKTGNLVSGTEALKNSERLLLWEIRKILPSSIWANIESSSDITALGKTEARELLSDILDEETETKNNADIILIWDILEDLGSEPDSYFQLDEEKQETLRSLVLRGNAAQLLSGIEDQSVLTSLHVKGLAEIRGNRDLQFILEKGSEFSEKLLQEWDKKDQEKVQKYKEEIEILQDEKFNIQEDGIKRALNSSSLTKAKRRKYEEAKKAFDDYWHQNFLKVFNKIEGVFENREPFRTGLADEFRKYGRAKTKGNKENMLNAAQSILNELKRLRKSKEEKDGQEREILSADKNFDLVNRFDDVMEEANAEHSKFQTERKALIDIADNEVKEELQKIKTKKDEIEKKYAKEDSEDAFLKKVITNFAKTKEQADEADKKYWQGLNERIDRHMLHAADLEVVWELQKENSEIKIDGEEKKVSEAKTQQFDNFRNKFAEVLNQQLEKIEFREDQIVGNSEDRFAPWISEVNRRLDVGELVKAMAESGFDFKANNPQIASELIKGAINFNKQQILDKLETKLESASILDDDVRRDFINKLRIHHKVNSVKAVRTINNAYNQYFKTKVKQDSTYQEERNKIDGLTTAIFGKNLPDLLDFITVDDIARDVLDRLGNQLIHQNRNENETEEAFVKRILTPHLKTELSEKEWREILKQVQILRAFDRNQMWLEKGDGIFPGEEKLNEARLQLEPLRMKMTNVLNKFSEKFRALKESCKDKDSDDSLKVEFTEFFKIWNEETKGDLASIIESVKSECILIFGDSAFLDMYFQHMDQALNKMDETVGEMKKSFEAGDHFSGEESFFHIFAKGEQFFQRYLNFRDGFWAQNEADRKKEFQGQSKTINTIKSLGFFEDEYDDEGNLVKKGTDKAREKFESTRADFDEKYNEFSQNIKSIKAVINNDLEKFDDDHFLVKYGFSKDSMKDLLADYDKSFENFTQQWGHFHNDPQFFDKWVERYNQDEKSRAEAINEFTDWEEIKNRVEEIAKNTTGLKEWLKKNIEWKKENGFFGRGGTFGSGYNVTFQKFSLRDIYEIWNKIWEHREVRRKRESDKAVSLLGQQIFGNTFLGKEFRRMGEDSEGQRVKEFSDNYNDLEAWEVRKYMYASNDPDEVRACVDLLKGKGFFQWDDPEFWKVLERLGGGVTFDYENDMSLDPMELQDKIRRACEGIWSNEVYRQWETSFDDDLNKAKSGWTREFSKLEDNSDERIKVLADMLNRWKAGKTNDIDPARYEEYIFASLEGGKMNGPSDKRWYFLIQGIAVKNPKGQSILSKDVLTRANDKFLANMPFVEFFTDKEMWKLNGEIVPEGTPGAHQIWEYEDYLAWGEFLGASDGNFDPRKEPAKSKTQSFFYHYIIQSNAAMDRAGRMQRIGAGNADHDDGAAYFTAWNDRMASTALSSKSEGTQQLTDDFWRNFIGGFDIYMRETSKYIEQGDKKYGDAPGWEKRRQLILKKVGAQLRTGIRTTQILQGNVPTSNQQPLVFGKDDWEKDTAYSSNAEVSRQKINYFMRGVLSRHGALEKHEQVLDYMGVNISKTQEIRKKDNKWKDMRDNAEAMLSENTGGDFFNDTGVIYEVMKDYYKKYNS